MSRLALYLLGPPRLERDGEPLHVGRTKAVALLAYLAVTGQAHSREALATLLSPEFDTSHARNELRRTLSVLNRLLGAGPLIADRETVALNPDADPSAGSGQGLWLDVDRFRQLLAACETHDHPSDAACPDCVPLLQEAVALYQGDFLAGFTLPDSLAFEEWGFFQSEGLRSALTSALERLVGWHSEQGENEAAIPYARRWLALDPLHEPAHRQLMALYAQAGRRSAALRQYRACLRALEEELGMPPAPETTALYERLRAARARPAVGEVTAPPRPCVRPARLPAFLAPEEAPAEVEKEVFVTRERELAQLEGYLTSARTGQGQVVFITGGPGRGKTALMREFARRAMEAYPDLLVATGNCNAYSGVGDPYLPFRQVIQMLTGDVESSWAAGAVTREHAQRLWAALPRAIQALLDHGTPLIDIFLPATALLSRAAAAALPPGVTQAADDAGWLEQLREAIQREKPDLGQVAQSQLFEGYTKVLGSLATQHPLLLILDDLQWMDSASVSLLFHLGQELGSNRVLIVGAYRAEEVALGRDGPSTGSGQRERHPLEKVLAEFKRGFGDVWLDLSGVDDVEGRRFAEAFLDTEPNRLGADFRGALFQHSGGHPLFTVELLRAMQERGDLVQDAEGRWTEGPTLDWETLPARVEAVIEERLGRLEEGLRDILTIASVEGEAFTAQAITQVLDIPEREMMRALARELGTRHRLVRGIEEVRINGRFLSRFQFAHAMFQRYVYIALSAGERRLLHGEIAEALETLYEGQTESIAAQLARHYAAAGQGDKAVEYSLQAGDKARLAYAHKEAIDHYRRALAFLKDGGEHERAARTLMKLGLTYHTAFDYRRARQAYDEGFALWQRASALPLATPPPPAPHALRLYQAEPRTLDPARAIDLFSGAVVNQLFSGLVELSPEVDVVPALAHSWEVSEGGRRYLFHLRDDARWSDGVPVTAEDFAYAWKRVLAPRPAIGSQNASLLYDVKGARAYHQGEVSDAERMGVRALDEVTLEVELERPMGYFLHLLAHNATYPVPRHVVKAHGEAWAEPGNIITNGPFRLETWQRGRAMVLVRNPRYHGRFTGNVQQVELSFLARPFTAVEMYEAGGLDTLGSSFFPLADLEGFLQRHANEYVSEPSLDTWYIGFDVSRPPFDDPRVRRAFALAIDREALADVTLRGFHFPATGGFIPPGMPGHSAGIGLPYDPERARRLLAEAGYAEEGGRGFPLVVSLAPHEPVVHEAYEYLQAQWRENLGIEITWETMEWGMYLNRLDQEPPHMFLLNWAADYADPDDFLRVFFQSRSQWQNEAYERLVEGARSILDQGERMKLYKKADRILVEEAPIVPLTYGRWHRLVKPWVRRFPVSPICWWFWKDVVIEPH